MNYNQHIGLHKLQMLRNDLVLFPIGGQKNQIQNTDVFILESESLSIFFVLSLTRIWWKKSIYDNIDVKP